MTRDVSGRLLVALVASLAVALAAPFVGQARGALQDALPNQYRNIVLGMVAIGVVGIMAIALTMIRERRLLRYGLLIGAVAGGVVYAYVTRTDNPEVNAVEWFHFVEYGLLTLLFHRVWRDAGDLSSLVLRMPQPCVSPPVFTRFSSFGATSIPQPKPRWIVPPFPPRLTPRSRNLSFPIAGSPGSVGGKSSAHPGACWHPE